MLNGKLTLELNGQYAGSIAVEINPEAFKGGTDNAGGNTTESNCVDKAWEAIGNDFGFPKGDENGDPKFCAIVKHLDSLQGRFQELAKRVVFAKNLNPANCESDYEKEWENLLNEAANHKDGAEHYFQGFLHSFVEQRFGNGLDVQSCYE